MTASSELHIHPNTYGDIHTNMDPHTQASSRAPLALTFSITFKYFLITDFVLYAVVNRVI